MPMKLDLDMRLSRNFTLREAVKSQVALRHGIDNTPPALLVANMVRVAENILQPTRDHFGIPITPSSWYRSPILNQVVGSDEASQHLHGFAVDYEVPGISNLDLARFTAEHLDFDQLILEYHDPADPSSGWVHCSYVSAAENRREIKRTINGWAYLPGLE